MNLLTIVIAYNPDYKELKENIYSYVNDVDHLIIWNNTPKLSNDEFEKLLDMDKAINNVEIRGDKENHLIAYPINRVIEWGIENNFTHILTMDQDSHFDEGGMKDYRKIVETFKSSIYGVNALIGGKLISDATEAVTINYVITSGSIYRLELFKEIGLLREDYGIDAVDTEICLRAMTKGYKTYILPTIKLHHCFGEPEKSKLGFSAVNYSPFRLYHITRNHIWLSREYRKIYKSTDFSYFLLKFIAKIILIEKNKIAKLKAICKGTIDGFFKRDISNELSNK